MSTSIDYMAPSCECEKQNTSTVLLSQLTKIACELLSSSLWSHHQLVPILVRFTLREICLSGTEKSGRGTGGKARSVENDIFSSHQPPFAFGTFKIPRLLTHFFKALLEVSTKMIKRNKVVCLRGAQKSRKHVPVTTGVLNLTDAKAMTRFIPSMVNRC